MEANFKDFVLKSSGIEISKKRKSFLSEMNGDLFYSINLWPKKIERVFWNKPIDDQEKFCSGKCSWLKMLVLRGWQGNGS